MLAVIAEPGGAAAAASTRRSIEAVAPIPCPQGSATVDARTAGMIVLKDSIICPPGSIIDAVYASLSTYDFNYQNTANGMQKLNPVSCGQSTCDASFTINVGSGSSGIVAPELYYTAHFPNQAPVKSPVVGFSIPINGIGASYPEEMDTRQKNPRVNVPFPQPPPIFQYCSGGITTSTGCTARSKNFATNLEAYYVTAGFPLTIFQTSPIEAHHIQPLCAGGNNVVATNGVYLAKPVHTKFTNWWKRVIVGGSTLVCVSND